MEDELLPQLKVVWGRYKYWIVFALFLIVILVASDNSMVRRFIQKREIKELQEQLDKSKELKRQNDALLNELNNDSLIINRIAREKYNMHREDEDLFIEEY